MTDRIVLANMGFQARHGVNPWEKAELQRFEVDVELGLDLEVAGLTDDLTRTVDYRGVYDAVQQVVEGTTFDLIEALAETIAREVFASQAEILPRIRDIVVRVRKPGVQLGGPLDHAGVEIRRTPDLARPELLLD